MDNQLIAQDGKNHKTTVALIHTLKTQGQQGEILVRVLEEMDGIKSEVIGLKSEMETHVAESKSLYEKMSAQVTITYEEQREIVSLIHRLAVTFTRKHEQILQGTFSDNLFKAWKGLFVRRMHSKLKERMNVARYTSIERVNYEEATEYLKSLSYVSFSSKDLEPTPSILKVLKLEGK